jgi:integrase/recombinase XerD
MSGHRDQAAAQPLELVEVDQRPSEVIVRLMLTYDRAVDDHLGDCARRGFKPRTLTTYRRTYDLFGDRLPLDQDVSKIKEDDIRRFLNANTRLSPGTMYGFESHLASLFGALYRDGKISRDPMDRIIRTRRPRPEDLDVVTVSTDDVDRLLAAARSWQERLALGVLCYLGPRKHATAQLRLSDYDELHKTIRFREKGSKPITKPVPEELNHLIRAALAAGVFEDGLELLADCDHSGDPFLIPPGAKLHKVERANRIVWDIVKRVAARAGVKTHVHALRAEFACAYLERGGDLLGLQEILGHQKLDTTRIYLRKLDKQRAMEPVRGFTRGVSMLDNDAATGSPQIAEKRFVEEPVVGAGGFEPPFVEEPLHERPRNLHSESDLLEALNPAVDETPEVPA